MTRFSESHFHPVESVKWDMGKLLKIEIFQKKILGVSRKQKAAYDLE